MPSLQQNTHVFADGRKGTSDIFNNYVCSASHMCPFSKCLAWALDLSIVQGPISILTCLFTSIAIRIIKIRWSHDLLIFIMGISIRGKTVFILKWDPNIQDFTIIIDLVYFETGYMCLHLVINKHLTFPLMHKILFYCKREVTVCFCTGVTHTCLLRMWPLIQ